MILAYEYRVRPVKKKTPITRKTQRRLGVYAPFFFIGRRDIDSLNHQQELNFGKRWQLQNTKHNAK